MEPGINKSLNVTVFGAGDPMSVAENVTVVLAVYSGVSALSLPLPDCVVTQEFPYVLVNCSLGTLVGPAYIELPLGLQLSCVGDTFHTLSYISSPSFASIMPCQLSEMNFTLNAARLALAMNCTGAVAGANMSCILVVGNDGSGFAVGTVVSGQINFGGVFPGAVNVFGAGALCPSTGGTWSCSLGVINVSQVITMHLLFPVPWNAQSPVLCNATVIFFPGQHCSTEPRNNSVAISVAAVVRPNLSVSMSCTPIHPLPGQPFVVSLHVNNSVAGVEVPDLILDVNLGVGIVVYLVNETSCNASAK
eukprot:RCo019878